VSARKRETPSQETFHVVTPPTRPFVSDEPLEFDVSGIDDPSFSSARDCKLPEQTTVVGIEVAGQARAFKLDALAVGKEMKSYEDCGVHVVKNLVGTENVWVTHCDITHQTRVFKATSRDAPPEIRVGGFDEGLVLRVNGRRVKHLATDLEDLTDMPYRICSWNQWRKDHPDTLVYTGATLGKQSR
jgi:hypothetical protein